MTHYFSALLVSFMYFGATLSAANDVEIRLTEDLRFGGGDDPVYVWPDTRTAVAVTADGSIYVADVSESRVLKFDHQGSFQDVVVHKGQGPGELEALTHFQILNNGQARAFQYQGRAAKLNRYDAAMKFQEAVIDWQAVPLTMKLSPDENFSAIEYNTREGNTIVTHVGLLDRDFKLKKSFSSTAMLLPNRERMTERSFWVDFFASISQLYVNPKMLIAFDQAGRVYTASSDSYKITRWDTSFEKVEQTFERETKQRPWSPNALDSLANEISQQYTEGYPSSLKQFLTPDIVRDGLQKSDVSNGRNPLAGLIVTPDNKLLVVLNQDDPHNTQTADVFAANGTHIGRLSVPNSGLIDSNNQTRMTFQGDYAYTVETVDDGVNQVVRYRIDWNSKADNVVKKAAK